MNLILEKTDQVPHFTDMRKVLRAAGVMAQDDDWYVSDIDTNLADQAARAFIAAYPDTRPLSVARRTQ